MTNFDNLYRSIIMEHYKRPRNKGLISDEKYTTVELLNPSCGDEVIVQYLIDNNLNIADIKYEGKGCSICCSSASIMSEALVNKNINDVLLNINEFYELIKGSSYNEDYINGDMLAFSGIKNFAARVKCATLSWKALEKGLKQTLENKV